VREKENTKERERGNEAESEKDLLSKVKMKRFQCTGLECKGEGKGKRKGKGCMSPLSRDFKSFPLSSTLTAHQQLPRSLPPTMPYPSIRDVAK
jgi:hypothetical protein